MFLDEDKVMSGVGNGSGSGYVRTHGTLSSSGDYRLDNFNCLSVLNSNKHHVHVYEDSSDPCTLNIDTTHTT